MTNTDQTTTDQNAAHWTFTFACPWGCTVHVRDGKEQPHTCHGTSLILDAKRVAPEGVSNLEWAEFMARRLDPAIRGLRGDSWETGVRDGRSGEKFVGIDDVEAGEDR